MLASDDKLKKKLLRLLVLLCTGAGSWPEVQGSRKQRF